jgi:hypothetical protein
MTLWRVLRDIIVRVPWAVIVKISTGCRCEKFYGMSVWRMPWEFFTEEYYEMPFWRAHSSGFVNWCSPLEFRSLSVSNWLLLGLFFHYEDGRNMYLWLTFSALHGVICQKIELFITNAVRTSDAVLMSCMYIMWRGNNYVFLQHVAAQISGKKKLEPLSWTLVNALLVTPQSGRTIHSRSPLTK